MKRIILLAVAALMLAACAATTFPATVTRFHQLPADFTGKTFTVRPHDDQVGSLEFQRYAQLVANELGGRGLRPLPPGSGEADLLVFMRYGADSGRTEFRTSPSPAYGSLGLGWGRSPFFGTGFGFPLGGPAYDTYSVTRYGRWLLLDILDGPAHRQGRIQKLFEGRVVNEGRQPAINPVMPYLVEAMFANFPGANGQTVRVDVPLAGRQ